MSQKEVIKFACPHCGTRLTVTANLAGIVGPCPVCQESIAAPKPRVPIPAKQTRKETISPSPPPEAPQMEKAHGFPPSDPYTRQRSPWLALFIPLFFLILTIGVIVSLFKKTSPKQSSSPPRYSENTVVIPAPEKEQSSPPVVQKPRAELEPLPPEIVRDQSVSETTQNAELILKGREILAAFLEARDFPSRQPFLTRSHRSDTELGQSVLAHSLPNHLTPELVRTRLNGLFFEAYFSVTFKNDEGSANRTIIIQTLISSELKDAKVNTDAFLDVYQQRLVKLSDTPSRTIETSTSLITYASFSFDDIPLSDKMALIEFHSQFSKELPPVAKAYVARNSDVFFAIKGLGAPGEVIPCTLTLGWELETDPQKPFLKVLDLNSPDWAGK